MREDFIRITGARQHNLKNISVTLPKNSLTVFRVSQRLPLPGKGPGCI